MAISSVLEMVHQRLPFTSPSANDTIIESIRVQMCYLMQGQTEKSDADVEPEANYKPLENMLFAAMVCYQMIRNKVILTMAGDGVSGSAAAKTLKKAVADVTEAEFTVVKATDGALLQMSTDVFLENLLNEICAMAQTLDYNCPWCVQPLDVTPAFIVGEDFPPTPADITEIYNGKIGN